MFVRFATRYTCGHQNPWYLPCSSSLNEKSMLPIATSTPAWSSRDLRRRCIFFTSNDLRAPWATPELGNTKLSATSLVSGCSSDEINLRLSRTQARCSKPHILGRLQINNDACGNMLPSVLPVARLWDHFSRAYEEILFA